MLPQEILKLDVVRLILVASETNFFLRKREVSGRVKGSLAILARRSATAQRTCGYEASDVPMPRNGDSIPG